MRVLFVAGVVGLISGCATAPLRPPARFTPPEELNKVRARERPAGVLKPGAPELASWELQGPFPDTLAPRPHESASVWARLLAERSATLAPSGALECAAREFARVVATTGQAPGQLLRDHVSARCGFTAPVALQWVSGEVGDATDDAVLTQWRAGLTTALAALPAGQEVGLAMARAGGKAAVMLASGRRTAVVEAVALGASHGRVVLRGTAPAGAAFIDAAINRGATRSARCADSGRATLPSFEVECELEPGDTSTWISLAGREQGSVLAREFATVLAWAGADRPLTWTHPAHVAGPVEANPGALVQAINALRASAKLAPATVSVAQSDENRELAPWLLHEGAVEGERLALGVLAGWRVESEISGGAFTMAQVDSPDGAELLNALMERPWSRSLLMGEDTGVLAAGLFSEQGVMATLVSAYARVQPTPWPGASGEVFRRLDQARAKRGLPEVTWVLAREGLEARLGARLADRVLDPAGALQELLEDAAEFSGQRVRGWRMASSSLQQLPWPPELLTRPEAQVVGFVTAARAPGEPWVEYQVFVVLLGAGDDHS